jgi:hypothetical protein
MLGSNQYFLSDYHMALCMEPGRNGEQLRTLLQKLLVTECMLTAGVGTTTQIA